MKKVLVAYYSKGGNTEKMAGMIADGLRGKGIDVALSRVEDVNIDTLPDFDGYIVGSPNYFGTMTHQVKKFFDDSVKHFKKLEGRAAAAFTTTGMIGGGGETVVLDIIKAFLIHGCVITGLCSAGHYGPVSIGAPDERIRKEAGILVDRYAALLNKL